MPGNFHAIPKSVQQSWPTPNYIDPIRRPWLPVFSLVFLGASTVLVAGRFYMRGRNQAGEFGLDDAFMSAAWLFSIGLSAVACIDADWYGLDRHTWDVKLQCYAGAALMGWIAQVLMLISTCATKCSVLLFYRRMVKDVGRWKYAIWAALAFTACYFVGVLVAYCSICEPLDAYWLSYDMRDPYTKPFKCLDGDALSLCVGTLSVVSDLYAVVLPMIVLSEYKLDVPRRQKIALQVIFGLGTVVAGAGVARTYYLWKINHTYDTSWVGFDLFVWSLAETHGAIVCACAPSLRAFFRRYLNDHFHRSSHRPSNVRQKERTAESTRLSSMRPQELKQLEGWTGSKSNSAVDENVLEGCPSINASAVETRVGFDGGNATPKIRTAVDFEAYNLQQLSKHASYRPGTSESTVFGLGAPRIRREPGSAV